MILVTGGTGLVGSHLLMKLVAENTPIRAIKRSSSDLTIVKQLFAHYRLTDKFNTVEWVDTDLLDVVSLQEAFKGVTHVYHCAASVSFLKKDAQLLYKVNVEGTANIVNLCLQNQVEKLCYVSSTSAIGDEKEGVFVSEDSQWKPEKGITNYSVSKYKAEQEVWRAGQEGLRTVIVNPGIIIGPGDWNKSSTTIFKTIHDGLKYYTAGENGFVDVRDVIKAMHRLMNSEIENERFLLISTNTKFKDVFDLIADGFNKKRPSRYVGHNLSRIAWRLEYVKGLFTGVQPRITKETTNSAHKKVMYFNQKIQESIDIEFIQIDKAVDNACEFFNQLEG